MKYNFTIRGTIGSYWWGTKAEDVSYFLNKHQDEELDVAICSPGGDVSEGLEIYQAFKDHGKIHAHIIGMTASMATVIAMGAKTVDMVKGSLILVHNSSIGVDIWKTVNKQQLQSLIDSLQKTKDDLKTIDDLIASIYSAKTGKTLDECREKMSAAAWINADDAKAFGFVDEIRDDQEAVKIVADVMTHYSNSIKDFGLPAIPQVREAQPSAEPISDENGNPTKGFIQKTWDALKDLVSNNHASNLSNSMKKTFTKVCAILGYETLESEDETVNLKVDDLQKVEDRIVELEKKAGDAETAKGASEAKVTDLQTQLNTANDSIKDLNAKIENLKKSSAPDNPVVEEETSELSAAEASRAMYNAYANY